MSANAISPLYWQKLNIEVMLRNTMNRKPFASILIALSVLPLSALTHANAIPSAPPGCINLIIAAQQSINSGYNSQGQKVILNANNCSFKQTNLTFYCNTNKQLGLGQCKGLTNVNPHPQGPSPNPAITTSYNNGSCSIHVKAICPRQTNP